MPIQLLNVILGNLENLYFVGFGQVLYPVGGTQIVKTLTVFNKYLGENLHIETRQNMIELREIYFLYNL